MLELSQNGRWEPLVSTDVNAVAMDRSAHPVQRDGNESDSDWDDYDEDGNALFDEDSEYDEDPEYIDPSVDADDDTRSEASDSSSSSASSSAWSLRQDASNDVPSFDLAAEMVEVEAERSQLVIERRTKRRLEEKWRQQPPDGEENSLTDVSRQAYDEVMQEAETIEFWAEADRNFW